MRRGPRRDYPRAAERRYRAFLLKRVRRLVRLMRRALREDVRGDDSHMELGFDADLIISRLTILAGLVAEARESDFEEVLKGVSASVNRSSGRSVAQLGAAAIAVPVQIPTSWTDTNLELIEDIDRDILERMSEAVLETARTGGGMRDLERSLSDIGRIGRNRAKLIARNEVGNINAAISEQRQTEVGVVEYIWSTSDDERVRPSHRALDGDRFRWDSGGDPIEGHPGQAINCRCVAIPVMPER